jgi:hypothetical protein
MSFEALVGEMLNSFAQRSMYGDGPMSAAFPKKE